MVHDVRHQGAIVKGNERLWEGIGQRLQSSPEASSKQKGFAHGGEDEGSLFGLKDASLALRIHGPTRCIAGSLFLSFS